mmetsp:Transcript_27568/g.70247  ORF Transcript_27568/g.70247 Transcript_27568/m.70247 type:complete len:336 (-) Transcript_27568:407-1414(-)
MMMMLALLMLAPPLAFAITAARPGGGVLVVGSANVDLVAYAPRMPTAGETISGLSFEKLPGGKGANQAVAAARLGSHTQFITALGQDALGDDSLTGYEAAGIRTEHIVRTADASTGVALITVDTSTGNNMIVVVPGAGGLLADEHLAAGSSAFQSASVLLTQLEVPLETTISALQRGRAEGMLTVCNTAPAPEDGLPDDLLATTDVLCPNESEAAMLTGMPTATIEECEAAAHALLEKGVGAIVMTLGERGCLLVTKEEPSICYPVPDAAMEGPIIDTIGAGDAFLGALACRLADGASLQKAIPTAIYAASISVQRKGAQASYASVSDLPAELME